MNILAFDTCFEACSAAVQVTHGDGTARVVGLFEPMAQGQAERLLPMISKVMADAGLSFSELDRIGVSIGPGSFTGTRICIAAARAFALATRVPLVGLSSLAVMAAGAAEQAQRLGAGDRPILIAVDVRREEAACQLFAPSGLIALSAPCLLATAQAADIVRTSRPFVAGSAAAAVVEAAGADCGAIAGLPGLLPDARSGVILVQSTLETTATVEPLYLRPPDAKPPSAPGVIFQQARSAS